MAANAQEERLTQHARYLDAKSDLRIAEGLGIFLSALAILAAVLPEDTAQLSWPIGVLSLVLLAVQMVFSHHLRERREAKGLLAFAYFERTLPLPASSSAH